MARLLVFGVLLTACGGEAATTTTNVLPSTSPTTVESSVPSTTLPVPSTSPASTAPSTTAVTTTTLPGEPIDFGPTPGATLMVIGVSHDDVLNLRRLPGTAFDVIAQIPPNYRDLRALGNTRDIGNSFWIEVDFEGTVGWVHMGFIGFEGATDDLTAYVVDQLGDRPSAGSMSELGRIVAELFLSDDPPSDVVKVIDETVGDVGEVTLDVVGLGDDSVRGVRLHVFGEPFEGGFALRNLEVTYLCGRDVTAEGICV